MKIRVYNALNKEPNDERYLSELATRETYLLMVVDHAELTNIDLMLKTEMLRNPPLGTFAQAHLQYQMTITIL